MANILSVETSGSLCSLAICRDGRWFEDTQIVERLHNQVVLAQLDDLSRRAGVGRNHFAAVAFGAGPGSFTGIRIAAALAQAVAFASGAQVMPVSSSLALAAAATEQPELDAAHVLTVTRSRRDAFYLAGYRISPGAQPECCLTDRLHQGDQPPADLPDAGWVAVGHRPGWWPGHRPFLEGVTVDAAIIGKLALHALEQGAGVEPARGLPIYVSGDSPWQPVQQP